MLVLPCMMYVIGILLKDIIFGFCKVFYDGNTNYINQKYYYYFFLGGFLDDLIIAQVVYHMSLIIDIMVK